MLHRYTLTLHSGKKFTCLGDEPYKEEFEKPYAENANWRNSSR